MCQKTKCPCTLYVLHSGTDESLGGVSSAWHKDHSWLSPQSWWRSSSNGQTPPGSCALRLPWTIPSCRPVPPGQGGSYTWLLQPPWLQTWRATFLLHYSKLVLAWWASPKFGRITWSWLRFAAAPGPQPHLPSASTSFSQGFLQNSYSQYICILRNTLF